MTSLTPAQWERLCRHAESVARSGYTTSGLALAYALERLIFASYLRADIDIGPNFVRVVVRCRIEESPAPATKVQDQPLTDR